MAVFDDEHGALWHDGEDGEEVGRDEWLGPEVFDGAFRVVGSVFRFCRECPWGLVAGADVDAAEEDRVDSGGLPRCQSLFGRSCASMSLLCVH